MIMFSPDPVSVALFLRRAPPGPAPRLTRRFVYGRLTRLLPPAAYPRLSWRLRCGRERVHAGWGGRVGLQGLQGALPHGVWVALSPALSLSLFHRASSDDQRPPCRPGADPRGDHRRPGPCPLKGGAQEVFLKEVTSELVVKTEEQTRGQLRETCYQQREEPGQWPSKEGCGHHL